jgi:hypothetical protein
VGGRLVCRTGASHAKQSSIVALTRLTYLYPAQPRSSPTEPLAGSGISARICVAATACRSLDVQHIIARPPQRYHQRLGAFKRPEGAWVPAFSGEACAMTMSHVCFYTSKVAIVF